MSPSNVPSKILFIMSGSIACYKACQVVSKLAQKGHQVQVVATASALKFIGNATIEGLTGKPIISDLFASGNVMDHIHLARWADLVIVAPATADFMNKMASGISSDLASSLFLAHDFKKPFLVAPAMNTSMYLHPATQESVKKLKTMGVEILDSASGILACGETGYGRLLEAEQILEAVLKILPPGGSKKSEAAELKVKASNSASPTKILVTAGGTQENIDDVRVLSNSSTGKTGYRLAHYLFEAGYDVELLRASQAQIPETSDFPMVTFTDYKSLDQNLQNILKEKKFTHVIHAAAVGDYSIGSVIVNGKSVVASGKIDSSQDINLLLKVNPKLISKLKSYSSNPNLKVIGFKLTSHLSDAEVHQKVDKVLQDADFVVHNDLKDIKEGQHKFTLWGLKTPQRFESVEQLSMGLMDAISRGVNL